MANEICSNPRLGLFPRGKFVLDFFDGQADDVAEGAGDFGDNQFAAFLDGVRAGFVEGIDLGQIFIHLPGRERAEQNVRADGEDAFAVRAQLDEADAGDDLVRAALELKKHLLRFDGAGGLAEDLVVEEDEGVRAHDERVGQFFGHGAGLAMGVELAKLLRREVIVKDLLRVAGDDFEVQLELPEQVRAARRG